ncbi:MAG: helix-turn-helix transcriptional regulator [Oribacterium sp.]|nr:helix-turn-helix transcriptional regulator [Oribacterium sp.]
MKRKMSYKKLWKLLIDRDMRKTDLRTGAGISSSSLAKLSKDENVTTDVLLRICNSLDVDLNDIVETVPEGETVLEEKLRNAGERQQNNIESKEPNELK